MATKEYFPQIGKIKFEGNERDGGIHKGKQYSIFFYCG